jgi:predicted N-acetyltransferase YhbS
MEIELRLEGGDDYKIVEELTREAFWNVHFPGCDEHLLIHNLRTAKEFVGELDFVAVYNNGIDNGIVGNIVYVKTKIVDGENEYPVLTFGPISVLPKYQNKGIGGRLIEHTKKLAGALGYKAIIIYGDPEYYKKFGFTASKKYNITNSKGQYPAALLVLELSPNTLANVKGIFDEGEIYQIDEAELAEFEKGFTPKEKQITKSQARFNQVSKQYL